LGEGTGFFTKTVPWGSGKINPFGGGGRVGLGGTAISFSGLTFSIPPNVTYGKGGRRFFTRGRIHPQQGRTVFFYRPTKGGGGPRSGAGARTSSSAPVFSWPGRKKMSGNFDPEGAVADPVKNQHPLESPNVGGEGIDLITFLPGQVRAPTPAQGAGGAPGSRAARIGQAPQNPGSGGPPGHMGVRSPGVSVAQENGEKLFSFGALHRGGTRTKLPAGVSCCGPRFQFPVDKGG